MKDPGKVVHRGIFKGFQGTHNSNIGYILIEDYHTHKVEKIPCENKQTIKQLHDCYGDVIGANHTIQPNPGFLNQEILWAYDDSGLVFGQFVPIEALSPQDLAIYDYKRFVNRWGQRKERDN